MFNLKSVSFSDSFIDEGTLTDLRIFFEKSVRWSYGWESVSGKAPFCHWNNDFISAPMNNETDYSDSLSKSPEHEVINRIWNKLSGGPLRGHSLVRCYANAHTYGVEGYPHYDAKTRDHFTTIVYINPMWKLEWAGETVFFDESGDISHAIIPKPGRIAIFPGNILHAARAVSRSCPAMRVTLMFKSHIADIK